MSSKRYLNGVKWLKENGFAAFDEEPCYCWTRDGIDVGFFRSEWYARTDEWSGDYCAGCTTPKSALKRMHKAFEEERDSFLKKAQECDDIVERLDKIKRQSAGLPDLPAAPSAEPGRRHI